MTGNKSGSFPVWATLFTVLCVVILCALGTWQLYRLAWKTDLLARIAIAQARPSVLVEPAKLDETWDFHHGMVEGQYDHTHTIAIVPRTYNGVMGAHLLTPLKLSDGRTIIVNRGWVPEGKVVPLEKKRGTVQVRGVFRIPEEPNMFVPFNHPEKGAWYRIDLSDLARYLKTDALVPVLLYAEVESGAGRYPVAQAIVPHIPNNHLQYALFWFSMAVVLVGVYIARFVRRAT